MMKNMLKNTLKNTLKHAENKKTEFLSVFTIFFGFSDFFDKIDFETFVYCCF